MFLANALEYHADMAVFIAIVDLMVWLAHRFVPPDVSDAPYAKVYFPTLFALALGGIGTAYVSAQVG